MLTLEIKPVIDCKELQYPMQLCIMTKEETKEYHLKFAQWESKWQEEQSCHGPEFDG
jgi:hypothetical protein